jgi:ADP-heptose:LPS heptosyltransferase
VPLSLLDPLLAVPNLTFYSLQVGEGTAEQRAAAWQGRITDLAPALGDFGKTAAAIAALDLVICVDTAVAHLAGALGKPVWVLIAQGNDWRWLHERTDTPWYPTMRLFRQGRHRNWQPAVRAMVDALTNLAGRGV